MLSMVCFFILLTIGVTSNRLEAIEHPRGDCVRQLVSFDHPAFITLRC